MRLAPRAGERIDRSKAVSFTFAGWKVTGFEGDTIASAAFAAGKRVFSRSFKYHRPRGLLCCSGHCPNCQMTVDGVPNVRVCTEPIREGAVVEGQNVRWSLDFDFMSVTDKVGGPFTPVGFYYRTFIRPRAMWPLYEKFLRSAAGLGKLDPHAGHSRRYDTEHRRARVLVVGGGEAGRAAALQAAAAGPGVVLVDEDARHAGLALAGVEVLAPARALGIWGGGLVPVDAGTLLYRFRAEKIVVATGAIEQPVVFPGNDLVGVMLPGGVRRLLDLSIRPGERAVVLGADDETLGIADELGAAGTEVVKVVDLRDTRPGELSAQGGKGRVRGLVLDGESYACDLLVSSGGRQPAYSLLAQAGARVEYDDALGVFVPAELPAGVEAVGSVTGEGCSSVSLPAPAGKGKCFVCICEDVTTKDLKRAIHEGFDSIELAKRYTTATMGPCQGKLCHLSSIRIYAQENRLHEAAIGTTTARPPWSPVELGLLAGRELTPARRGSIHWRHEEAGATIQWAGPWKRPYAYGEHPEDEVRAVHESLGVIDVSTLGKLLVEGPEAVLLLERLYPNRFGDMKSGRIRYGVLTSDAGRIMDDGTVARLADDLYYVTTTSTGADSVTAWFEWWNAVWGYEAEIVNVTGALAAVNLAGPRSREALGRLVEDADDVSAEAFGYLDARELDVAGIPTLALRIGFVGELGYELHVPSPAGEHLWDALVAEGAQPFGLEPQRVLRLEKGHVIVGQDTDSESNLYSAGMSWLPKMDKDDFVGRFALEHFAQREEKEKLVGFTMEDDVLPAEGAQIVVEGLPAGRVTSARRSAAVGAVIGLAWVPLDRSEPGTRVEVVVDRQRKGARIAHGAFFDPGGERMRS